MHLQIKWHIYSLVVKHSYLGLVEAGLHTKLVPFFQGGLGSLINLLCKSKIHDSEMSDFNDCLVLKLWPVFYYLMLLVDEKTMTELNG